MSCGESAELATSFSHLTESAEIDPSVFFVAMYSADFVQMAFCIRTLNFDQRPHTSGVAESIESILFSVHFKTVSRKEVLLISHVILKIVNTDQSL